MGNVKEINASLSNQVDSLPQCRDKRNLAFWGEMSYWVWIERKEQGLSTVPTGVVFLTNVEHAPN